MSVAPVKSPYGHAQYFAALDGFRGILAIVVAIYHTIWLSNINSSAFLNNGAVIIDMFFAFSGFLMFTLYSEKLTNKAQAKAFMIKRFARLYPLHLFMLAVFLVFALLRLWAHQVGIAHQDVGEVLPFQSGANETWRALFAHLTLTHAMGGAESLTFNPPSWTIGAEFYTYFVFIGFMFWVGKARLNMAVAGIISLCIMGLYFWLSRIKPNMDITYDYGFIRCLAGFFIGVLAARLHQVRPFNLSGWKANLAELAWLAAGIAFVVSFSGKGQFLFGPLLFLFVYIFAADKGVVSRFLDRDIFRYLGKISYSVYMTHVIIAIAFDIGARIMLSRIWPDWQGAALAGDMLLIPYLLVVIGVSHLTYHFVEVPGGRFLRRVLSPRKPAPPATASPLNVKS